MTAADDVQKLTEIRRDLVSLHKALLTVQQRWYEEEHQLFDVSNEMYELLIHDPAFAWLRRVSDEIVEIDEKFADKGNPISEDDARALIDDVRELIVGKGGGYVFRQNYKRALQAPHVVILHGDLARLLCPPT